MLRENFDVWRQAAVTPYQPTDAQLQVPIAAVEATFRMLSARGPSEACVFWYGRRDGGNGLVTDVRAPAQVSTRFNYHVDERAFSRMADTIAPELRPLEQIHSHPGKDVEHSPYDDEMVASRNALSIVFPFYGCNSVAGLTGLGVHEHQHNYWHLLLPEQAARRVITIAGQVHIRDLR